jgi:hypothetical protein
MLAPPSRAWNGCKPIVAEHWDKFTRAHPRDQTAYYEDLVAQLLAGGHPAKMGASDDRGRHGGQGKQRVAMRGQSALGLRGAKVAVDHGGSQGSQARHAGGLSRPLMRTVPAMFRPTCSHTAAALLSALRRCGAQCLDDV